MERLTKRIDLGNGKYTVDFSNERCGEFLTDHKAGVRALFDKLAAYEDAEEQLLESTGADLQSMIGEFMHYYNLQKEGRLVELPCKVGDIVYRLGYSICHLGETFEDSSACLGCLEECTSERVVQQFIIPDIEWIIKHKDDLTQRNVNVFWYLTREEAEGALKWRCL